MDRKYGISEWNDVDEINGKLNNLFTLPARKFKKEALESYMEYFETKCKKSKELAAKAKNFIPGGVQHNLALNHPFPVAVRKVDGPYMWDIDDNQYIDFLQAGGPTILGSNYKPVRDKIIELLNECGPVTGLLHEYEYKLAELINKHMPSVEMLRMLGSGTEAAMASVRISRAYTKHKKIVKIGGAYHGWSDQMVFDIRAAGIGNAFAAGIQKECYENTQAVPVNDIEALRARLKQNEQDGGTACVILEPIGPESGTRPVYKEYNRDVRKLCDEFGALLIFDEVVSGFRVGLGGAQGYFNVSPDLTVFGKALTGGYPAAGGVGGKKKIMSCLAPGLGESSDKVMVGGTLSANPLSCVAGYYAILETEKTEACIKAGAAGDRLTKGLRGLIEKYDLPFVAFNQGPICHFDSTGILNLTFTKENMAETFKVYGERAVHLNEMGMALMAGGVVTIAANRMYMSLADTDEIIDEALNRFERLLKTIE